MSATTFTASDGKEYLADTWYPWPFTIDMPGTNYHAPYKMASLPLPSDNLGLLRIRDAEGNEGYPNIFYRGRVKTTHWKIQLSGHYEI